MAMPTDDEIATAVPMDGNPSRALTQALLKNMAAALRRTGTEVRRVTTPENNQVVDLSNVVCNASVVVDVGAFIEQVNLSMPGESVQYLGQTVHIFTTSQVFTFAVQSPATITGSGSSISRAFYLTLQNVGLNEWAPIVVVE